MKTQKDSKITIRYMPINMSIGLSIGIAIGSATGNMPVAMCIGLALGLGIGVILDAKIRKEKELAAQSDAEESK